MEVKNKKGVPSLVLTIEIRPGLSDSIEVRLNDKISVLVREFCEKHGLGASRKEFIYEHLRLNVMRMLEELGNSTSQKEKEKGPQEAPFKNKSLGIRQMTESSNKAHSEYSERSRGINRTGVSTERKTAQKNLKPPKFMGFASRAYKNKLVREANSQLNASRS